MKKDFLKDTETNIRGLIEKRDKEISERTAKLSDVGENIQALDAMMSTFLEAGDDAAYMSAAKEKREAEDLAAMQRKRIEYLKRTPLLSEEELRSIMSGIKDEWRIIDDSNKHRVLKAAGELKAIGHEHAEKMDAVNSLAHLVQVDACLKPDTADKLIRPMENDVYSFVADVVNDRAYKRLSGIDITKRVDL